jgi:hypothetical protein
VNLNASRERAVLIINLVAIRAGIAGVVRRHHRSILGNLLL